MKKFLIACITILCMLCCIPVLSASAAGASLFDEGSQLKAEENSAALKQLQEVADKTNLNIIVILSSQIYSDTTIESTTASVYEQVYGKKTDGVCLYMDVSSQPQRYHYLDTSGLGQFYYTNQHGQDRVNEMFHAIAVYLSRGREDIPGAIAEFCNQLTYYYDLGIPEQYWVYDDIYHEYYHVENGAVIATSGKPYTNWNMVALGGAGGLLIGLIAALITYGMIKSHYQFKYEISPTTYVNKRTVSYRQQYDHFVTEHVTKTPVSSDSSRSGGGSHPSGGGHSSGGHGGGGYHT